MAKAIWTGSTSTDFNVASNWAPSGVPANGDTLLFNDQAVNSLLVNTTQAAKTFDVFVDRGFAAYAIGTQANPLKPDAFNSIIFNASNLVQSFFQAGSTNIARAVVNSASALNNGVVLQGTLVQIVVLSGKVGFAGTPTISGRVQVVGSTGSSPSELTIPSASTLTGCEFYVEGGKLDCSSDLETIHVADGEFIINGGMDITGRLEMTGGRTWWDAFDNTSPSTVALAEILGGTFATRKERTGRTLTTCNMYGSGSVDFRIGGIGMTVTNPIRAFGTNQPVFPMGTSYAVTI